MPLLLLACPGGRDGIDRRRICPGLEACVSEPPPEQPYSLPGTEPAWEPSTLPEQPLTAARASALLSKEIG